MFLALIIAAVKSSNAICICNHECPNQCSHDSYIFGSSKFQLNDYLFNQNKKGNLKEIDLYSKNDGFSFKIDPLLFNEAKITLKTLSDSKSIKVIIINGNSKNNDAITINPGNQIIVPDSIQRIASSYNNNQIIKSKKDIINSQQLQTKNTIKSENSYVNQKYSQVMTNQIHVNINSPITQISGCSFNDIESDLYYLIQLEKEVSFFDNTFNYNEKSQKTASPLFVNYNGKLTISHCTFTNAKFSKNDGATVLSTSQSQIEVIFDSCSFTNCGSSEIQSIIKLSSDKSSLKMADCDITFDNKERSSKVIDSKSSDISIENCKFTKSSRNSILINSKQSKGTFLFTNNEICQTNNQFIEANSLSTKPIFSGNVFSDIELTDKYLITCFHDQTEIEIENTTFSKIKGSLSFCFRKIDDSQYSLLFTQCNFYDIENMNQDQGESSVQIGQFSSVEKASLTFQTCNFMHNKCHFGKGGALGINNNNEITLIDCVFDSNEASQNCGTLYFAKSDSNSDENQKIRLNKCKFNLDKGSNGCYIYNENEKQLQIVSCSMTSKIQNENQNQFAIYSESKEFSFEFSKVEFERKSENNLVFCLKSSDLIQIDNSEFINCINNKEPTFRFDEQTSKSTTSFNNCEFISSKLNPLSIKISGGVSEIKSCYINFCSMEIEYAGSISINNCMTSNCESMKVSCISNDLKIKEEPGSNPFEITDSIIENEDLIDGNIFNVFVPTMLYKNNTATITGDNSFNGMNFKVKGAFTFADSSFTNFGGSAVIFTDGSQDDLVIDVKNCTFDKCGKNFFFKFASKKYLLSNSKFEDIIFEKESKIVDEAQINNLLEFDKDFEDIQVESCNFTRCYSESAKDLTSIVFTPRDDKNVYTLSVTNCNFESCNSTHSMYCVLAWTRMKEININHNSFIDCISDDKTGSVVFITATTVTYDSNRIEFTDAEKGRSALKISTSGTINVINSQFIRTNSDRGIELTPYDNGEVKVENCEWLGNIGTETRCFRFLDLRNSVIFKNNTFEQLPSGTSIGLFDFHELESNIDVQTIEDSKFINNDGYDKYGNGIQFSTIKSDSLKFINCKWINNKPSGEQTSNLSPYEIKLEYDNCYFETNEETGNGEGLFFASNQEIIFANCEIKEKLSDNKYAIQIKSPKATYQNNQITINGATSFNCVYFEGKGQYNIYDTTFSEIKGSSLTFTDSTGTDLNLNVERCSFIKCKKNINFQFESKKYLISNSKFEDIIFEEDDDPSDAVFNNLLEFGPDFEEIKVDSCYFTRCYSESTKKHSCIILTPEDKDNLKYLSVTNCNFESCNGTKSMCCILAWTRMKTNEIIGNTFKDCIVPDTAVQVVFITATTVTYDSNRIEFTDAEKGRCALRISTSGTINVINSQFIRTNSDRGIELIPYDYGVVKVENCEWLGNIGSSTRCFQIYGLRSAVSFKNNTFEQLPSGSSIGMFKYEENGIEIQTIEDTKFIGNSGNAEYGGGSLIIADNSRALKFVNCQWKENKAINSKNENPMNGNGGAFQYGFSKDLYQMALEFDGCLFEANEADSYGGALSISTISPVKIINCQFKGNKAGKKADITDPHHGGAIYFDIDFNNAEISSITRMESATISNCIFTDNVALNGGEGNSIYIKGNERTIFTIDQKTNFINNDQTISSYEIVSQTTKINLNDVEFKLTKTNTILFNSESIQINDQSYQKVKTNTDSILKFQNDVSIIGCEFIDCISNTYLISSSSKSFTFENSEIQFSENSNGGLNFESSEKVTINQCNFSKCAFKDPIGGTKGGAINLMKTKKNDVIEIKGCSFNECKADFGGGIYYESSIDSIQFKIIDCEFIENAAETSGGCIFFKAIQGTIENCFFKDNSGKSGSDIYYECSVSGTSTISDESSLTISECVFEQQKEEVSSLIFFVSKSKANFKFNSNNITFTNNNNKTCIFDCSATTNQLLGKWSFDGNRLKSDSLSIKTKSASDLPADCGQGFICDLPFIPGCIPGDRCHIDGTNEEISVTFVYINKTQFNNIEFDTDGGSIHLINCGINCYDVEFNGCKSKTGAGGGIYIYLESKIDNLIEINEVTFTSCSAVYGGGICAISKNIENKLRIKKCTFTLNTLVNDQSSSSLLTDNDEKFGGSAIYLSFPNSVILRCKFSQNSGKGSSVKIINNADLNSVQQLEMNDLSISIIDCLFEIDSSSSCSLYYSSKNKNKNAPIVNVKNCIFDGKLDKSAHHIDGFSVDEKPKLNIQSCKFSADKKFALNLKSSVVSFDLNQQQFNYNDKNELKKVDSNEKIDKNGFNALVLIGGIVIFAVVVIVILVVKFVKDKINNGENDLVDDVEVINLNFGEAV